MLYVLVPLYIIACLFLIGVVLLQQGKGADLAGAFGVGGGTQAAFGARGATTLLHRLTTWAFVGFIVLSLTISVIQARGDRSSVLSGVTPKKPAAATLPPATGAPAPQPIPVSAVPAPATPGK